MKSAELEVCMRILVIQAPLLLLPLLLPGRIVDLS